MSYSVRFAPEALAQLEAIEQYIGDAGSTLTAMRYVDSIIDFCEGLVTFPQRCRQRDDLFPGLRITNYRGSAVVAYLVDTASEVVTIVGVYYGGQDYESALREEH
ncbi:MAG: type II toxin-antitoxin system RelE/ParE family toxin [Proteobacteria bacterium]|nr:type II toxin-antitoxin system RelE/ParE family toxin [Pseudomonadota bacterium]